jgi:NTP pyrophosphatase (non-canonical NTP hydrolase)
LFTPFFLPKSDLSRKLKEEILIMNNLAYLSLGLQTVCCEGKNVYIHELQNMMRRIYFYRDFKRGVEGTYRRLREEVDELGEATQNSNKKALEDEFADVIAWLASLANILKIDLEKAALRKYNNCCPKCLSSPCECALTREKS